MLKNKINILSNTLSDSLVINESGVNQYPRLIYIANLLFINDIDNFNAYC